MYKRCSQAGSNFDSLAQKVEILHGCLEITEIRMRDEAPGMPEQLRSLDVAKRMCEDTPQDVEKLLAKCDSLGTKSKRFIDRMRFTTADIERLEARLASSGSYLQTCNVSLILLSSRRVEAKLSKIEAEYRDDTRPKSVLSAAIIEGTRVDEEVMMAQAEEDLMGEDVHPDAIDLYREGIRRWILAIIDEEDAEEPRDRPSIVTEPTALSLRTRKPEDRPEQLDEALLQIGTTDGDKAVIPDSSQAASKSAEALPLEESDNWYGLRSLGNSEAPSREVSIKSHASKDSRWHPSNEEDASFVASMISKPFKVDPIKRDMPRERILFYFNRAFSQLDYLEQGGRSRPDVISACQDAMRATNSSLSAYHCDKFIYEGDTNNDATIDRGEFLGSMNRALSAAYATLREGIIRQISSEIQQADASARERQSRRVGATTNRVPLPLPWGFQYLDSSQVDLYDIVQGCSTNVNAPQPLPLGSFTLLAQEVYTRGNRILNSSSVHWLAALPRDRRLDFNSTFDRVRSVAIRFDLLYRDGNEAALSDLDEMLAVLNIVQSAEPSEAIKENLISLRNLRVRCESIGQLIRGFTWRLERMESEDPRRPSPQTLKDDLAGWEGAHMNSWSWLIAESANLNASWEWVVTQVQESRQWYSGFRDLTSESSGSWQAPPVWQNKLHSQAIEIARSFVKGVREENERRKAEHLRQPLKIMISELSLKEDNTHKRLHLSKCQHTLLMLYLTPCGLTLSAGQKPPKALRAKIIVRGGDLRSGESSELGCCYLTTNSPENLEMYACTEKVAVHGY